MFIDETWTKTNMAPLRGWAPRGARLRSKLPWVHWNTMTFIAALRVDRIDAPWLLDGPISSEAFLAYVTHELVPTLSAADRHRRRRQPRQPQKQRGAQRHPTAGARLILLPKYSPDLNAIEQVFAKLKHLLRKAAARSREAVSESLSSCSTPTRRTNVPTTSETQDTPDLKSSRSRSRNIRCAPA